MSYIKWPFATQFTMSNDFWEELTIDKIYVGVVQTLTALKIAVPAPEFTMSCEYMMMPRMNDSCHMYLSHVKYDAVQTSTALKLAVPAPVCRVWIHIFIGLFCKRVHIFIGLFCKRDTTHHSRSDVSCEYVLLSRMNASCQIRLSCVTYEAVQTSTATMRAVPATVWNMADLYANYVWVIRVNVWVSTHAWVIWVIVWVIHDSDSVWVSTHVWVIRVIVWVIHDSLGESFASWVIRMPHTMTRTSHTWVWHYSFAKKLYKIDDILQKRPIFFKEPFECSLIDHIDGADDCCSSTRVCT